MKVVYNRQAYADVFDILTYLSELNPAAAARLEASFETASRVLSRFPEIGTPVPRRNVRRMIVGNYVMFYEVGPDVITILYIRHGARKPPWQDD